jgi:large subunit ribosomal protein L1
MGKKGKKYTAAKAGIEDKIYSLKEAVEVIKANSFVKFDETVDMAYRLGVDFKKSDQRVRGSVTLPHGTGKSVKILVFATGDTAKKAEEAGADYVGMDDLIQKIKDGWLDFDVAVASNDAMNDVKKLGKFLGPHGLMPSPKAGTLTDDVAEAVNELKKGKMEFKMDRHGNVHVPIGKVSFENEKLIGNAAAVDHAIKQAKPAASKGQYILKCVVSSTMGIGVPVAVEQ